MSPGKNKFSLRANTRKLKPERRCELKPARSVRDFNYELDFTKTDFRKNPELYRVGKGEQGVLLVEPYKSEILPLWRFKASVIAKKSSRAIYKLFLQYKKRRDFVGMDMARKFIQMGFTRARRYANHRSGRKYGVDGRMLAYERDPIKAAAAQIFKQIWDRVEADPLYAKMKVEWKRRFG